MRRKRGMGNIYSNDSIGNHVLERVSDLIECMWFRSGHDTNLVRGMAALGLGGSGGGAFSFLGTHLVSCVMCGVVW